MRERHEDYMKRRIKEEDRLIHESPDGGRTIRTRAFRSSPEEQKIYDYLDTDIPRSVSSKVDSLISEYFINPWLLILSTVPYFLYILIVIDFLS